jgi:outer membrane lipoprotein-sorting protein
MTSVPLRSLLAAGCAFALAVTARAAEPAIIAKARAYVGSEAALNGVKSIHFIGTLVTADPADPAKQTRAALEIYFQKPEQQRIMATSDKSIEVTALDGYDGWQRVQDPADATKWQVKLLGADQIKRLRANTWENLAFFRGLERQGGSVEEQGTATVDGVACVKLAFIHAPAIVFYRFFDPATGRLVYTETEAGGSIREHGEMMVNGLRFPKSIVTVTKNGASQTQTVTITFEKITVNETVAASLFAVPMLLSK